MKIMEMKCLPIDLIEQPAEVDRKEGSTGVVILGQVYLRRIPVMLTKEKEPK